MGRIEPPSPAAAAYAGMIAALEQEVAQTFGLWDKAWVGFSWRAYYLNHTQRVRALCRTMSGLEDADPLVLDLSALLHDITKCYDGETLTDATGKRILDGDGFWRNQPLPPACGRRSRVTDLYDTLALKGTLHSVSGSRIASELLASSGVAEGVVSRVARSIRDHVRPPTMPVDDWPVESRVLLDADTLDANMGLVAFYRNVQIRFHRTQQQGGPVDLREYVSYLPTWLEMKEGFVDRMATVTGKRLAIERQERNRLVYQWLREELADFEENRQHGVLAIIALFVDANDAPDLETQRRHLNTTWLASPRPTPRARQFCHWLDQEVAGQA